jgi:hypothetical protein
MNSFAQPKPIFPFEYRSLANPPVQRHGQALRAHKRAHRGQPHHQNFHRAHYRARGHYLSSYNLTPEANRMDEAGEGRLR